MALRNVVHRRNHKERSQPTHRAKFGLLEKHKDYIQRARDHNVKKARIQKLAQKASLRNPDEFNFGMIKNASNDLLKGGGLYVQRRSGGDSEPLENDLVAILKSQDLTYVRGVIRGEEKKMEEIRELIRPQLGFMTKEWIESKDGREDILVSQGLLPSDALSSAVGKDNQPISLAGKKTVWVEDVAEARRYKPETATKTPKKRYSLAEDDNALKEKRSTDNKSAQKRLGFLVSQLEARQQRLDTLNDARSKLETVKALMTTKGTNARKVQSKTDALKAAVMNGKVTSSGLSVQAQDDDDEDEEMSLGEKKKKKITLWKWGRERKK